MTTVLYSSASSRHVVVQRARLDGLGLHPQRRAGTGHAGADPRPLAGAQHGARAPPGSRPTCSIVAITPCVG